MRWLHTFSGSSQWLNHRPGTLLETANWLVRLAVFGLCLWFMRRHP